jgi:diguanylate cyclase (GGDEF)-like protein
MSARPVETLLVEDDPGHARPTREALKETRVATLAATPTQTLPEPSPAPEDMSRVHVLLVEDNPADAYLIRDMLAEGSAGGAQFTVTHVQRLVQALERIGDGGIDVALLDLSLPDAHGLEIVARVRGAAPGLPIVIVSRNQDEALAIQGVREGAQDYLVKGQVGSDVLVRALRYAIERQQTEERLTHVATHDPLTGLPNRALFHDRLGQILLTAQRPAHPDGELAPFVLLLLDLNRFKAVNDTLGHHVGDQLLRQVGARVQGALRAADTIARLGGDEFAVLLPGSDAAGAITVATRIVAALDKPFEIEGQTPGVGASIGIALYPTHGADGAALLRHADVAMYSAKRGGGGYAFYDAVQDERSPARLTLAHDVRRALDEKAFRLHYQPIADLSDGRLRRVEALPRWTHLVHGEIGPDQAVPLAEQAGIALPLTAWMLDETLRQCVLWDQAGSGTRVDVAVNISLRALRHPRLSSLVASLLGAHNVAPARLTLEVSEDAVMADPKESLAVLTRLHGLGVRLAIDDFGTGYSSLTYLQQLPVDDIKIDRLFVAHMGASSRDATLVRAIIALARALGLAVVAEGVETRATWELLQSFGCPMAQGPYITAAVPQEHLR